MKNSRKSPPMGLPFIRVGVFLYSSVASAFVLPGGAVLRHMVASRDAVRLSTLRVEGTVSFFGDGMREAAAALQLAQDRPESQADVTLSLRFPGRCRLDATSPEGGKLAVLDVNGRKRADGGSVTALSVALGQVCRLLSIRGGSEAEQRAELDRYLRSLGVQTALTSLERQGDQVAYVLGKPGSKEPQFWVFKDSFLPARIRFLDESRVPWEVRFVDFNSPSAGEWFPRVVEVSRGAERLLRLTVLKADPRVNLPERLFAG